jgi:polysaccharide biosynthesis/export protein
VIQAVNYRALAALCLALCLAACTTSRMSAVPAGEVAYQLIPPADPDAPRTSYVIVPNDVLNLQVFQEPDLSNEELQVDNVGNIQMPLIGEIPAAGRSPSELAADIAERLSREYIVNPQVVISVREAAARFVTVEGQVAKPGVYEIDREYTLLSAIARAESPTNVANLDEIVVFRTIDGERAAARFDLRDIRAGIAPDPQILGGDVVVVGCEGSLAGLPARGSNLQCLHRFGRWRPQLALFGLQLPLLWQCLEFFFKQRTGRLGSRDQLTGVVLATASCCMISKAKPAAPVPLQVLVMSAIIPSRPPQRSGSALGCCQLNS